MRASQTYTAFISEENYLAQEDLATYRSEYVRGTVYAMAGGTEDHAFIIGKLATALNNKLLGRGCRVYPSELRVNVPQIPSYFYPDVSVVCGKREFLAGRKPSNLLNPQIICEVLSDSTAAYDRGKKFQYYQRIVSLQQYILVSPDEPLVEYYLRQESYLWLYHRVEGLDAIIEIPSLQISISLRDIYDEIEFANEDDTLTVGGLSDSMP